MSFCKLLALTAFLGAVLTNEVWAQNQGAVAGRKTITGHLNPAWKNLSVLGRVPSTNQVSLAIGLPLRDRAGLERFIAELYNPASTNFHRFLTPEELAARFGPTPEDYEAMQGFARSNGLSIATTHGNRLLLDVRGQAGNIENAFHLHLNRYQHPTEPREFFAPDAEPSVAASLPLADIQGLSDYSRPRPHLQKRATVKNGPRDGTAPDNSGEYFGDDLRHAYVPGTALTGTNQAVGVLEFDGFYTNDVSTYASEAGGGRSAINVQTVLIDSFDGIPTLGANSGNSEVALDIEMAMAMAPGLSRIVSFEGGPNGTPNDVLNTMLASNTVKNLSCSWGWTGGPSTTTDSIFLMMAAAGQSFFNASGDTDAFVPGSNNDVDDPSQGNTPDSNPYVTQVGGTVLTMNGAGASYASETSWNDGTVNPAGGNWGSSGGVSTYYSIPSWQTNTSMMNNGGSTNMRDLPDVAFVAKNVYIVADNGQQEVADGTSCGAPGWAGLAALANQQAASYGNPSVGFANPALYALSHTGNYTTDFHDITTGNNAWSASGGNYQAVAGYDLVTGLGSPTGTNLINALAPALKPVITASPVSRTNVTGTSASFTVTVTGSPTLAYQWYFTNAIPGATSATLTINPVTGTNAGNYFVVVTNIYGLATSAVAQLTVRFPAAITIPPVSETNIAGQAANLGVTATGTAPLRYQWFFTNAIPGATNVTLNFSPIHSTNAGNYFVVVTNNYGKATSAVVLVTVIVPPAITAGPVATNLYAGRNATLNVTATGTVPLGYQWYQSGVAVVSGANLSGAQTNLLSFTPTTTNEAGNYTVVVTNSGGSATSSPVLLNVVSTPGLIYSNMHTSFTLIATGCLVSNVYQVQLATNLSLPIVWTTVKTNTLTTNSTITFVGTNVTAPHRYFRLKFP